MIIKFWAELLGTAFLVLIVLGSGVMAQNLFPGQPGLALLVNSIATGLGLFVLIQSRSPLAPFATRTSICDISWKVEEREENPH